MRNLPAKIIVVLLVSISTAAADPVHSVAIGGAGSDACSTWMADRSPAPPLTQAISQSRVQWILGFLSGVNLFGQRSGELKGGVDDPKGALLWIDNYCGAHPTDPLFAAAAALVFDLRNHPRD